MTGETSGSSRFKNVNCFLRLVDGRGSKWNFETFPYFFTDHSKSVYLLWIICVIYVLCSSCIAALWSPAGKGMTSWLSFVMFICVFVTFPCGILRQVWYLTVSNFLTLDINLSSKIANTILNM